jgi:signal transduction histidine kinase
VVFFPPVFFGSFAGPFADITGRVAEFTGARSVSILAMVAVLLLGRATLNTFAATTPRPAITVVFIALTVVTGSSVQNGMLIALGFTDTWNIGQRLLVAGPGLFTLLLLACLVVSSAREQAAKNRELALTAAELTEAREKTVERAQEKRQQLVESVRQEIDQALTELSSNKKDTLTEDLNYLLDDVIRPMSFRLAEGVAPDNSTPHTQESGEISWPAAFQSALETNPAHPNTTTLWLAILVGIYLVTSLGWPGVLAAVFSAGIAWVSLTLLRRFWEWSAPLTLRAQSAVYSAVVIAYSSGTTVVMTEISGYNFLLPHVFAGYVLLSLSMAWTISLVYGLHNSLDHTHRHLDQLVADLHREVITANNDLRTLHKMLSRALHGPVQSHLLALMQRLDNNRAGTDDTSAISLFRQSLEQVLTAAVDQGSSEAYSFDTAMADLIEFWEEVATITVSIDPALQLDTDAFQQQSQLILELMREACGNAIKHGKATTITISVHLSQPDSTIQLTVENDGRELETNTIPGVGSRIFDESCLSWKRYQAGERVRVEAVIPR